MTFFQIFILSIVQGLTEFLPVSSSGHLVLAPHLTGVADQGVLMDVALHIGTMLAIVLYYRRDVWNISWAVLQGRRAKDQQSRRLGLYIAAGSVPALLIGGILHFTLPEGIRSVGVITFSMVFFGLLMGVADLFGRQEREIKSSTLRAVLAIGAAQALALIPGTSRSGITMTAARFMGFKRVDAARLSFLLGLPVMAAAGFVSLLEIAQSGSGEMWADALTAIALSFLAGLAAIHFMMRFLQKIGLLPFVFYRMFLGGFLFVYFFDVI